MQFKYTFGVISLCSALFLVDATTIIQQCPKQRQLKSKTEITADYYSRRLTCRVKTDGF